MTRTGLQRIGSNIERQFEIMEVLEQEISGLRAQTAGDPVVAKRLAELESLLKLLAKTTHNTSEEIFKNVA
jgi:hypothetical protein